MFSIWYLCMLLYVCVCVCVCEHMLWVNIIIIIMSILLLLLLSSSIFFKTQYIHNIETEKKNTTRGRQWNNFL